MQIIDSKEQAISRAWLILAISALALAGLFSLPPVILRGPFFEQMIDTHYVFATALVLHVDLSVLVWLLAMSGVIWSITRGAKQSIAGWVAFILAALGMVVMACSAFVPDAGPLKNNYVPVLENTLFFWGLTIFALAITWQVLITLFSFSKIACPVSFLPGTVLKLFQIVKEPLAKKDALQLCIRTGAYACACTVLIAVLCFILTYVFIPDDFFTQGGEALYELMFWEGGHVLQFAYTGIMMLAWVWLAAEIGYRFPLSFPVIGLLLLVNMLLVVPLPFLYVFYEVGGGELRHLFTQHMRMVGGIVPIIIGIALVIAIFKGRGEAAIEKSTVKPIQALVFFSFILFMAGGLISLLISGSDARIPAHYHGSIVGVTTSLMALCYYLLPVLGFGEVKGKLAVLQPYLYGGGQLMHITGLAWMGGYGALRKAPGSSAAIETIAGKILFFTGGGLAIIGGLLFVIVAVSALLRKRKD